MVRNTSWRALLNRTTSSDANADAAALPDMLGSAVSLLGRLPSRADPDDGDGAPLRAASSSTGPAASGWREWRSLPSV